MVPLLNINSEEQLHPLFLASSIGLAKMSEQVDADWGYVICLSFSLLLISSEGGTPKVR